MNTFIKPMSLLVLLVVLTACRAAGVKFNTDAAHVVETAQAIARFELPEGYSPEFSVAYREYTIAAYSPGDDRSHLYLIQVIGDEIAGNDLLASVEQLIPGDRDDDLRMEVITTISLTVRRQDTVMVISEGINGEGQAYVQAMVPFQGDGGPALLVFSESAAHWELDRATALAKSIQ